MSVYDALRYPELRERYLLPRVDATSDLAKAWEEFDAKARVQEPPYEKAAIAQLESEAIAVVRMIEAAVPNTKSLADILAVAVTWPKIEAALLKIYAAYSASGTFFRQWYNRFRPLIAKTMAQSVSTSAINRRVTRLTENVTEATARQIRDLMAQAQQDVIGVDELLSRLRSQVFSADANSNRARTIARTETVGALNEGAMLKAQRAGRRSKRWISQQDGKVRESHVEAEAQGWIPIDQLYSNGLHYPHEPGAPADEVINCRCSQEFTDSAADEANGGTT